MAEPPHPPPRRRDLLTTSAMVLAGGGLATTLWPLISATQPDAETRAREKIFNTGRLAETGQALVQVNGTPVLIFRRAPADLEALAKANPGAPAQSSHRAQRPAIMVVNARCPHDACVVVRNETYAGGLLRCPCCASTFDLAGRRTGGPAARDLDIPPHRYLSDFEIELDAG